VEITCRVYKPRRPRESPLFRLVDQHLEELLRVWPHRFARTHGPLRPVVERVLREFLACGLAERGFARAWCSTCRKSYLIPYSCRGRSFCPSCEKKRSLLWAEWLRQEVLEPVPHRHVVVTIPRLLRPLFRRRRELLRDLARCASDALGAYIEGRLGEDLRPGIVVSIATAGDLAQWHPHLHVLASDGGFSTEGTFYPLEQWDGEAIMTLFREALLERLVAEHAISGELQAKLLTWRHPGFSAHAGEPIPPNDARAIEDMASYVVRNPVSLRRLVYIDGHKAVIYRALKPNPRLGANFVALDPLEWLARIADHIPDPGKHRTLFYSYYANRARGARAREKELLEGAKAEAPEKRRCSPSWARLIAKVYHADPLICRACGGRLQIVAYIHDQFTIRKILDHLGLSPPEVERPPPDTRYVPIDHEGRELESMVAEELHSP
jgi:hypothetical protein